MKSHTKLMIDIVYRRYHKLRYLLRIKHYRGRKIHSPFMYSLMRGALMGSHNHTTKERPIYIELRREGFKPKDAGKIARVYHFLDMNGYRESNREHRGEDMVIMPYNAGYEDIVKEIATIGRDNKHIRCIVIPYIYKSKENRTTWRALAKEQNVVSVDLFSIGLIFVSEFLQKQSYKLRI